MAGAHGLVVRVEDVGERVVERAVAAVVLPEDERLEEPRDVCPVPLRRAHVGHGLHRLILGAEDGREPFGGGPNPGEGLREVGRRCSTALLHRIRPFATPPGAVARTLHDCGSPYPDVPSNRRVWPTFRTRARRPGGSGVRTRLVGGPRRAAPRGAEGGGVERAPPPRRSA